MREYPERSGASIDRMVAIDRRIPALGKMALVCAALVLAITSLSAFIRLSRAGLGCEPWPQCYAQSLQATGQRLEPPVQQAVVLARIAHRVVAVATLLIVIAMLMATLSRAPVMWREGRMVLALLALALFLAVLGRWTTNARVPAVMLGNLLAGFAMFALCCQLVRLAGLPSTATPAQDRLARWARLGVALLAAQIVLGGLVSAGHAGLSCPHLLTCDVTGGSWQFLNPWHETPVDVTDPVNPAGALVHGLHRAGALVLAAVLLPLAVAAWRSGRRAGAAVILLLLLVQVALGMLLVGKGLPLIVALAHNVTAAFLLATLLGLTASGTRLPVAQRPAVDQRA